MEYRHENLFGGQGVVLVKDLLTGPAPDPFTTVLSCRLAPLGSVGEHCQELYSELIVVTAGEGQASVNGVPHPLHLGTVVGLPLGAVLALNNTSSDTDLEYLIVKGQPTCQPQIP